MRDIPLSEIDRTARTRAWHEVVSGQNLAKLEGIIADDAVFHSPVVHSPQRGKQVTILYLSAAFRVLVNQSFRYVREVNGPIDSVLEFEADVDGTHINGVDMIRWNDAGQIVEFKVMVRPLQAINLLHKKMQAMLDMAR